METTLWIWFDWQKLKWCDSPAVFSLSRQTIKSVTDWSLPRYDIQDIPRDERDSWEIPLYVHHSWGLFLLITATSSTELQPSGMWPITPPCGFRMTVLRNEKNILLSLSMKRWVQTGQQALWLWLKNDSLKGKAKWGSWITWTSSFPATSHL